jgi:KipI family sensor histidine kinase inhibitor
VPEGKKWYAANPMAAVERVERVECRPAGDRGLLIRLGEEDDAASARRVRAFQDRLAARGLPGVREVVPGSCAVLVDYDPGACDVEELMRAARASAAGLGRAPANSGRDVEIPAVYGGGFGPDLEDVAALHGLSARQAVALHAGRTYTVHFLGFSPGFAYMGDLPARLQAPRRTTPRTRVPAGSVALAGRQTAIYPRDSPGGWHILGRTPRLLYDPGREPPALLRQGDRVHFRVLAAERFAPLLETPAPPPAGGAEGRPGLRVDRPGPLTTVQDLGRFGHQAEGVPPSGAVDAFALRLANRLVGNEAGAAGLEVTVLGPELTALADLAVAACGADLGMEVDGRPVPPGVAVRVRPGAAIRFRGPRRGCRACLAVGGGIAVPPVLGSRSTDLLGGFGGLEGRPLRAGDVLPVGDAAAPPGDVEGRRLPPGLWEPPDGDTEVAFVPGPQDDWFDLGAFAAASYEVSSRSDRMGLRLEGAPLQVPARSLPSEGTPLGGIQVPPDGRPIVLLAGRQTVGGYPKVGVVVTPDVYRLAQVRPGGGRVRFRAVGLAAAQRYLREWEAALARV